MTLWRWSANANDWRLLANTDEAPEIGPSRRPRGDEQYCVITLGAETYL